MSVIEIRHLSKRFTVDGHTLEALRDISLTVEKGEIYGIIGMSGAGKSTLVRSVNYLEKPSDGIVLVDGVDLGSLTERELRKKRREIGMIFQNFNLLEQRNVIGNICFPLEITGVKKKVARDRARELLRLVNLEDKETAYPSQLSGGQKQRVAIARALATEPRILLCDEPTGALDYKTSKEILQLIETVNQKYGSTIIMVTHNDAIKNMADRVVKLRDGVIRKNYTNESKIKAVDLDW